MNYPKNRYTGEHPWMDREWLYNEYVVKDRSSRSIAEEYGCKQNTIQQWLSKHGIKKEIKHHKIKRDKKYMQKDYLVENYVMQMKSVVLIAEENGVSCDTILYHLKRNGIKIENRPNRFFTEEEIDEVRRLYVDEELSAYKIAKMYGTSHGVVIRNLKEIGLETRNRSDAQLISHGVHVTEEFDDAEWLRTMHWEDGFSCKEIGNMLGVDPGTVRRKMHKLGLATKTNSESKVGLMSGESHPNWQGGLTPLKALLREYTYVNQVPTVLKRDGYRCQMCGAVHVPLHVHHKIAFAKIVNDIVNDNRSLDVNIPEDRIVLYNIIINDAKFCDEDNLITLCRSCHLYKAHGFKKKTSSQALNREGSETIPQGSTPQAIGGGSATELETVHDIVRSA